jgi:tetratricopeptide (TPR) repeat protein
LVDPHTEPAWLDKIRAALLRSDGDAAQEMLTAALARFPRSVDLRRILARVLRQRGRDSEALDVLQELLRDDPQDVASAFTLAHMLIRQHAVAAAATILASCFAGAEGAADPDLAISAIELLDNAGRKAEAAAVADNALVAHPDDARLHAYAGVLQTQLGNFELARTHYLAALDRDERAWEWHVPLGLVSTQQYLDAAHPDFARLTLGLERGQLSRLARAELHFALAKIHDDVGRYAAAAGHLRPGNALCRELSAWPREVWRGQIAAALGRGVRRGAALSRPDFVPVFIVGMPRTGTTLLAAQLARRPGVCNRGEPTWLAQLAQRTDLDDASALQVAASEYACWSAQDDGDGYRWFIDKQPLNFRFIDHAVAKFPHAKIIRCVRSPRDTALSLWMQCFLGRAQDYSYDFDDIAMVMRDEDLLMQHWQQRYPDAIRIVRYEDLVSRPEAMLDEVARWLGVTAAPTDAKPSGLASISTSSVWQARQRVHVHSIGRWQNYADLVPELLQFLA